jgi:hypothetical protein
VAALRIELQDGFEDDEVVCTVGGREVARRPAVRTDLRISRADAIALDVADAPLTVGVRLPARGLAAELGLDPREHPYLLVRIVEGRLELRPSGDLPVYF